MKITVYYQEDPDKIRHSIQSRMLFSVHYFRYLYHLAFQLPLLFSAVFAHLIEWRSAGNVNKTAKLVILPENRVHYSAQEVMNTVLFAIR